MIQFYFVTVVTTIFSTFCFFKLLAYMQIILLSKSPLLPSILRNGHCMASTLYYMFFFIKLFLRRTFYIFPSNIDHVWTQYLTAIIASTIWLQPNLLYVLPYENFSTTYSDPVYRLNHSLAYSGMASVISFRCFSFLASTLY